MRNRTRVTDIDRDGVAFRTAEGSTSRIAAKTVLWAGGVKPSDFARNLASRLTTEIDTSGRIKVNPTPPFRGTPISTLWETWPWLFVRMELPFPESVKSQCRKAPMRRKRLSGACTESRISSLSATSIADMAVIGRHAAVAKIFRIPSLRRIAWLIWLFIHLMYLVEFQSRIVVFIRWGIQYLTFSRGAIDYVFVASDVLDTPAPLPNKTEA